MELKNHTILITGGSSGIGFEMARRLLELGNKVIITGRDLEKLEEAQKKLPDLHIFQSDVNDPESIKKLYVDVTSNHPDLNFLINNAGIMRKLSMLDDSLDLDNINREVVTNLSGPIRMVKQFLPHLMKQKSATILNVSSGLAFIPYPLSPIYSATKAGMHSFTMALRVQLRNTNIKVIELAPPGTDTPLNNVFDQKDTGGSLMNLEKMVDVVIKGLKNDKLEIKPGLSKVLYFMSRLAPYFMMKQLSRTVDDLVSKK